MSGRDGAISTASARTGWPFGSVSVATTPRRRCCGAGRCRSRRGTPCRVGGVEGHVVDGGHLGDPVPGGAVVGAAVGAVGPRRQVGDPAPGPRLDVRHRHVGGQAVAASHPRVPAVVGGEHSCAPAPEKIRPSAPNANAETDRPRAHRAELRSGIGGAGGGGWGSKAGDQDGDDCQGSWLHRSSPERPSSRRRWTGPLQVSVGPDRGVVKTRPGEVRLADVSAWLPEPASRCHLREVATPAAARRRSPASPRTPRRTPTCPRGHPTASGSRARLWQLVGPLSWLTQTAGSRAMGPRWRRATGAPCAWREPTRAPRANRKAGEVLRAIATPRVMWTGTAAKPVELGQVEAGDEGLVARDVIRRCGRTVALGICPKNANTGRGSDPGGPTSHRVTVS